MSFQKHNFADGDILTADMMNKIEDAIYAATSNQQEVEDAVKIIRSTPLQFVSCGIGSNANNLSEDDLIIQPGVLATIYIGFSFNRPPTSIKCNDVSLPVDTTLYKISNVHIASPQFSEQYTIQASYVNSDGETKTISKTFTVYGASYIYYKAGTGYNDGLRIMSNSLNVEFFVNASAGEYIWALFPNRMGTPTFIVNGITGGFRRMTVVPYGTPSELYSLWRSDYPGLGQTTVKVV